MPDIKIKNTNSEGKSLRIQHWNGKIPTYDTEQQRAAAVSLFPVDNEGVPENAEVAETKAVEIDKLKKAELIEYVQVQAQAAGKTIEIAEDDTKAMIIEKFEALEIAVEGSVATEQPAVTVSSLPITYDFNNGNLLKEETLANGEEKVIAVTGNIFITIKEEA